MTIEGNEKSKKYLWTLIYEHEHCKQALATLLAISAVPKNPGTDLWRVEYTINLLAQNGLLLGLAKLTEKSSDNMSLIKFCDYAEQNYVKDQWCISERSNDEQKLFREECQQWKNYFSTHELMTEIKQIRDKQIAHLDKKHHLAADSQFDIDNISCYEYLNKISECIDYFLSKFDNSGYRINQLYRQTTENWIWLLAQTNVYESLKEELERDLQDGNNMTILLKLRQMRHELITEYRKECEASGIY
ncbi:MAG: hypothetical protein KF824_04730 [Fimbriimonadaceae bacterium]|nr:MAG: hypothetical protein KF824_04730 [Fimbriimonadaceae bacterium]